MRGANPPLPYPTLTLLTLSDPKPTLPFPRGTFAALETAFGMGERRDVWYNMRIEKQMSMNENKIVVYQPNDKLAAMLHGRFRIIVIEG